MDRLTAMRVFIEVARRGSFTASADRLTMSRAAVTRHVGALETWLGVRLLQRTTRRVSLTQAGEQTLERCLQILALTQEVEAEVAPAEGELRGQLRLSCSPSFAQAQLATALNAFLERHPGVKIDLDASDRAVNLVEARIDLALRIGEAPDPGLIARPLAPCDSRLVASPDYLARHGTPAHPAELARHHSLGHAHFGRGRWHFTRDDEELRVAVTHRLTANETAVLLEAVIGGGGLAVLPTYLIGPALARGELLTVLPDWRPPRLTLYGLYTSRRHQPPALRALLDFLVERFERPPW